MTTTPRRPGKHGKMSSVFWLHATRWCRICEVTPRRDGDIRFTDCLFWRKEVSLLTFCILSLFGRQTHHVAAEVFLEVEGECVIEKRRRSSPVGDFIHSRGSTLVNTPRARRQTQRFLPVLISARAAQHNDAAWVVHLLLSEKSLVPAQPSPRTSQHSPLFSFNLGAKQQTAHTPDIRYVLSAGTEEPCSVNV